jgi:hypothetical protein
MLSVTIKTHAQVQYGCAQCHYDYAECHYYFTECHYDYAECRYAECRGAMFHPTFLQMAKHATATSTSAMQIFLTCKTAAETHPIKTLRIIKLERLLLLDTTHWSLPTNCHPYHFQLCS